MGPKGTDKSARRAFLYEEKVGGQGRGPIGGDAEGVGREPSPPMGSPSPETFPKREMRGGPRRAATGTGFSKVVDLALGFRSVATRPPEDL